MFDHQLPPQAGQALQFQLTSFMGGSNMLKATLNDASLRRFEADANNAFGTPTQSNHKSSLYMDPSLCATAQGSLPIRNAQSPQLSPELSFPPGLGRTGSSSDWFQQQTSAANNDSLTFSSDTQSYNPGQNHYSHSAVPTQMTVYDVPQQPYERGDGECQHGPLYSRDQLPAQLFENDFSSIPVTLLPYNSSSQPQASSPSQPDTGIRSEHSSNGSTPTATYSGIKDMIPDIFGSADGAHNVLYSGGSSGFCLPGDMQSSPSLETSNSYHSPETDSGLTLSSFELADNQYQVSNTGASHSHRFTTSHHGASENTTRHLSLRRSPSTRPSNRGSSLGQAHLQPKPQKNVAEGTQKNGTFGREIDMPRKGRGKRTKPLEEVKRKAATRRRNERTVCIGCKLAKVSCNGREHGRDCERCTSNQNNAPKPFVCAPASFIELIQQGSTMLLALQSIYSASSNGFRRATSLPSSIDVRQLLGSIGTLQRSYGGAIQAYEGGNMLFELDLQACWAFIKDNYAPTTHSFRQFIDGLKFQRQDDWKACIKNNTNPLANLCETLFTWDDAAPHVTYSTVYEISHGIENRVDLDPNNAQHTEDIVVAAQLYRIIGRQLELQFYDHLKKALGSPSICHDVVIEVGRAIISLRRRLAPWTRHWNKNQTWDNVPFPPEIEPYTDEDNDDGYSLQDSSIVADRVRNLCLVLYVYFCYMKRRLPVEEQNDLHTMEVRDPDNDQMVEEHLPQYESIRGFEDWLQFID